MDKQQVDMSMQELHQIHREAMKSAAFQFLLANKYFTMWEGIYFVSPASLIFLGTAIYFLEFDKMVRENA